MSAAPSGWRSRSALVLAVLLPSVVLCLFAWVLPKDVFWITDGGNRYIQLQSFARAGAPAPPAIAYPAADLDPVLRFFPWGGHHFQRAGGRIVSYYLPYFALLSLPGYRLAGAAGLGLLPLAAAIALLGLLPLFWQETGLGDWRAPATLGVGLGTPLLFYGLTFWEHSLAVLLALGATVLLLRAGRLERLSEAAAAGVLLGLSTVLREEGYVLFVALLAASLWAWRSPRSHRPPRRSAAFAAGWLATLLPIWWLQERLYGSIFGIHAAAYGGLEGGSGLGRIGTELGDLAFFLLRFHPDPRRSALLAVPFVLALLWGLRRRQKTGAVDLVLLGLGTLAAALLVVSLLRDPEGIFDTLFTQGLLPHTPFLLFALLGLGSALASPEPPTRFLAVACVVFALLLGLPLNRGDVGIIWGPRHFLDLYPLLAALALLALRDLWGKAERPGGRRTLAALAAVLVLLGLAVENHGLALLARKEEGTERLLEAVRAGSTDVVVTDAYWLTEELAALYFERKILLVESDAAYRDALSLLAAHGYSRATVVLSHGYGQLSPVALGDIRRRALGGRRVETPGLDFLDVAVVPIAL